MLWAWGWTGHCALQGGGGGRWAYSSPARSFHCCRLPSAWVLQHTTVQRSCSSLARAPHKVAPLERHQQRRTLRKWSQFSVAGQARESKDQQSLYDSPALYDAVFSSRDVAEEVQFLLWAYQQYCKRKPVSFLDLCCGPAEHTRLLSREGVHCTALDSSPAMLSYAISKAMAPGEQTAINFINGDMTDFQLEEEADLIGLLHGSVAELHTHEAALSCLRCIHRALSSDGLLVLEMLHPKEIFTGTFFEPLEWDFEFEGQDWTMCWGQAGDLLNPFSQIVHKSIEIVKYRDEPEFDESDNWRDMSETLHRSTHVQRIFAFQEIVLLASMAGLELVATYGDLELPSGTGQAAPIPETEIPASEQVSELRKDAELDGDEASWERAVLCFRPRAGSHLQV